MPRDFRSKPGEPVTLHFDLAEMQVFSDDENVALGKTVTAEETAKAEGWAPEFLVDGFSSRSGLISYGEYLTGLANRGRLDPRRSGAVRDSAAA